MAKSRKKVVIDPMQPVRISLTLRHWQIEALQGKEATREVIYSIVDAMTTQVVS